MSDPATPPHPPAVQRVLLAALFECPFLLLYPSGKLDLLHEVGGVIAINSRFNITVKKTSKFNLVPNSRDLQERVIKAQYLNRLSIKAGLLLGLTNSSVEKRFPLEWRFRKY